MKNKWKIVLLIVAIIASVGILSVIIIQSSQNTAIALEEQVNTANSDIKVQEKRRIDLIYNIVD